MPQTRVASRADAVKKQLTAGRYRKAGTYERHYGGLQTLMPWAHAVHWHWVRGHAGHDLNERADELVGEAIAELMAADRAAGKP